MCLQFSFVIFLWKGIGENTDHKILVKLTTAVNFINILGAAILNESVFYSFYGFSLSFQFFGKRKLAQKLLI